MIELHQLSPFLLKFFLKVLARVIGQEKSIQIVKENNISFHRQYLYGEGDFKNQEDQVLLATM